jgi:putative DNA primase/helicase
MMEDERHDEEPPLTDAEVAEVQAILAPPQIAGWRQQLLWKRNAKGIANELQNHTANATTILSHDERWVGVLSLNEFSQLIEFVKRPPTEPRNSLWLPRMVRDTDITSIANWIAREHNIMIRTETVGLAVNLVGDRNRHHPVREYLGGLEWDGTQRISTWLEDFMGATSTRGSANYIRNVGRAWMVQAVARIYEPGCKADHVLILEGAQGIKKSTAFYVLGQPWFTDQINEMGSKDASMQTQGVWIIELAELDAMSRHEVGRVNAFLTIRSDRIRPPYGHNVMHYDRQCVFAGTVNHTDYLRDETGNRRFWPVRCENRRINITALEEQRDQLWAEAVMAYKNNEIWWLEDERAARLEQEDRMQIDAWEEPISRFLDGVAKDSGPLMRERPYTTVPDVFKALQIAVERQGKSEQIRVVSVLKRLGWLRRNVRLDNGQQWRYVKEPEDEPLAVTQENPESGGAAVLDREP